MSQCFLAYRGSVSWSVNVDTPGAIKQIRAYRHIGQTELRYYVSTYDMGTSSKRSNLDRFYWSYTANGTPGMALTNTLTEAGLNVQVPMYNQYKFTTCDPILQSSAAYYDVKPHLIIFEEIHHLLIKL